MHIWTDLLTREAVFVLTLLALGAGPAAFLSTRIDSGARLALAPVLGLCVGVALTDTLLEWQPVQSTYWVLVPVTAVSLAAAGWRMARKKVAFLPTPRDTLQLVVIAIAVLGPASLTLHARASVGPVTFNVYDAAGYVAETDSEQTHSIEQVVATRPPYRNLTEEYWEEYAREYQNVDATALEASVNDFMGLYSTDTQSPFMIVLMFVGALGAYAACRYAMGSPSWVAVLAGALFGGSFFMQLWADSSQAAICGLAVLLPFMVVGAEVLRDRRIADHMLLALIAAGLLTVYPLFVPAVACGSVIVLVLLALRQLQRRRPTFRQVAGALSRLLLIAVLAALFTPVAFSRDLRYWQAVLEGTFSFSGLPVYHLPVAVLPGWILQTRDFYSVLDFGVGGGFAGVLSSVLLPLVMLAVVVAGVRWQRRALVVLPVAIMCALFAVWVRAHNHCGYCEDRNLLPLAPMTDVVLALGVGALLASGRRLVRIVGIVAAVVIVGAVAGRMRIERRDILDTAYFLDPSDRAVLSHLPAHSGPVLVEGFGESLRGPGELPLVYDLVNEHTDGNATIALDSTDYSSFTYLEGADQPAAFEPYYRFVLTRFAGIQTGRRLVARSDGIALEERVSPLDVTPVAGLGTPLSQLDREGAAWVQGGLLSDALLVYVAGGDAAPVWVHLEIEAVQAVAVPRQPGVTSRLSAGRLSVCMRAYGTAPWRRASLGVSFSPAPAPQPYAEFQLPLPAEGEQLLSMDASTRHCQP